VKIKYTKHAEEAILERGVPKILVEQAILKPDFTQPGRENKIIHFKNMGKNYLKVVVVQEATEIVVITLHWIANPRLKL